MEQAFISCCVLHFVNAQCACWYSRTWDFVKLQNKNNTYPKNGHGVPSLKRHTSSANFVNFMSSKKKKKSLCSEVTCEVL